jgi:rhodanese-related sulfurtransferase
MIDWIKSLFGLGTPQVEVVNDTSHPNPKSENLSGAEFRKAYEADPNAVMLDVRTGMEVGGGTLPDAEHIDYLSSSFRQKAAALDKSKTYYIYCKSGGRSDMACSTMHKMGFDVRNLRGGKGNWDAKS